MDIKNCLILFDTLTKKEYLLFYLRHFKRASTFKPINESTLFADAKMKELLDRHYAFSGFEMSNTLPIEFDDYKLEQNISISDVPCFLIFRHENRTMPTLIAKIPLKGVDSWPKEQALIDELSKIVKKTISNNQKNQEVDKTPLVKFNPSGLKDKTPLQFEPKNFPSQENLANQKQKDIRVISSKNGNIQKYEPIDDEYRPKKKEMEPLRIPSKIMREKQPEKVMEVKHERK